MPAVLLVNQYMKRLWSDHSIGCVASDEKRLQVSYRSALLLILFDCYKRIRRTLKSDNFLTSGA